MYSNEQKLITGFNPEQLSSTDFQDSTRNRLDIARNQLTQSENQVKAVELKSKSLIESKYLENKKLVDYVIQMIENRDFLSRMAIFEPPHPEFTKPYEVALEFYNSERTKQQELYEIAIQYKQLAIKEARIISDFCDTKKYYFADKDSDNNKYDSFHRSYDMHCYSEDYLTKDRDFRKFCLGLVKICKDHNSKFLASDFVEIIREIDRTLIKDTTKNGTELFDFPTIIQYIKANEELLFSSMLNSIGNQSNHSDLILSKILRNIANYEPKPENYKNYYTFDNTDIIEIVLYCTNH
jgi:hypothetical protein